MEASDFGADFIFTGGAGERRVRRAFCGPPRSDFITAEPLKWPCL